MFMQKTLRAKLFDAFCWLSLTTHSNRYPTSHSIELARVVLGIKNSRAAMPSLKAELVVLQQNLQDFWPLRILFEHFLRGCSSLAQWTCSLSMNRLWLSASDMKILLAQHKTMRPWRQWMMEAMVTNQSRVCVCDALLFLFAYEWPMWNWGRGTTWKNHPEKTYIYMQLTWNPCPIPVEKVVKFAAFMPQGSPDQQHKSPRNPRISNGFVGTQTHRRVQR